MTRSKHNPLRSTAPIKTAAAAIGIAAALLLAGCGSNRSKPSAGATPASQSASDSTTTTAATKTPLAASATPPTVSTLTRDIDGLYRTHPDLTSYVVQNTAYSTRSRQVVLHSCTAGGAAATSQQIQSARLIACSPMIFYYYSYGTQHNAPDATRVADELFSFAAEDVRGPLNAPSELETLLHAWGITVDSASVPAAKSLLTPAQTTLLTSVDRAILSKGSVRVTISGYHRNGRTLVERIVADMSKDTANETITEATAHARIDVTPTRAFLSGDRNGLTKLVGLSSNAAKKAGSRWIQVDKGSREYTDLASEDTLTALPATILPDGSNTVTLTARRDDGKPADVFSWAAAEGQSNATLRVRLEVSRNPDAVPMSETTTAGADLQTASFSNWGERVTALTPPRSETVSYTSITRK